MEMLLERQEQETREAMSLLLDTQYLCAWKCLSVDDEGAGATNQELRGDWPGQQIWGHVCIADLRGNAVSWQSP